MSFYKKIGRRAAGTWGRPRKHYAKQQSSRAIRRMFAFKHTVNFE